MRFTHTYAPEEDGFPNAATEELRAAELSVEGRAARHSGSGSVRVRSTGRPPTPPLANIDGDVGAVMDPRDMRRIGDAAARVVAVPQLLRQRIDAEPTADVAIQESSCDDKAPREPHPATASGSRRVPVPQRDEWTGADPMRSATRYSQHSALPKSREPRHHYAAGTSEPLLRTQAATLQAGALRRGVITPARLPSGASAVVDAIHGAPRLEQQPVASGFAVASMRGGRRMVPVLPTHDAPGATTPLQTAVIASRGAATVSRSHGALPMPVDAFESAFAEVVAAQSTGKRSVVHSGARQQAAAPLTTRPDEAGSLVAAPGAAGMWSNISERRTGGVVAEEAWSGNRNDGVVAMRGSDGHTAGALRATAPHGVEGVHAPSAFLPTHRDAMTTVSLQQGGPPRSISTHYARAPVHHVDGVAQRDTACMHVTPESAWCAVWGTRARVQAPLLANYTAVTPESTATATVASIEGRDAVTKGIAVRVRQGAPDDGTDLSSLIPMAPAAPSLASYKHDAKQRIHNAHEDEPGAVSGTVSALVPRALPASHAARMRVPSVVSSTPAGADDSLTMNAHGIGRRVLLTRDSVTRAVSIPVFQDAQPAFGAPRNGSEDPVEMHAAVSKVHEHEDGDVEQVRGSRAAHQARHNAAAAPL